MNKELRTVGIKAAGYWVPEKILENSYFSDRYHISPEWIIERTGIVTRRMLPDNESTSDLAFKAAERALKNSEISAKDIDCIIVATSTPDMPFPSTACLVQHKLDATSACAFDIFAACSGFIYGLQIGYNMVAAGLYENVMVIGAEALTRFLNWEDKNTAVLFGDGAGCVILSSMKEKRIISFLMGSDGECSSILSLPAGGSRLPASLETVREKMHSIHMNGKETYKACVNAMTQNILTLLDGVKLNLNDIDYLITHQANERIIKAIVKKLNLQCNKVFMNVNHYGNTAAASIPIALCECMEQNKFKSGDKIVMTAFGAGLTWGSCLINW